MKAPDSWIYDAVRTPRGRGRDSGSLYTVRPRDLLVTALDAIKERTGLPDDSVDDVVVGCVSQVGDQGSCIARTAVMHA
jgi:acetyl-CoA C-acetyltransferase